MPVSALSHYSIRTSDLEKSRLFYTQVLGLSAGFRPAFDFEGYWLYLSQGIPEFGVVHLFSESQATSKYLGKSNGAGSPRTGAIDHIAFEASDWSAIQRRIEEAGLSYTERTVPGLGLLQVFLLDPDGISIELNFSDSNS